MKWSDLYNPIMKAILRSPLHGLLGKGLMLMTFKGRRSGKEYVVPVNYTRDGDMLTVASLRERTWWRNLRGGVPVTVRVQGQDLKATAEAIEDEEGVTAGLIGYLRADPRLARYFKVTLGPDGQPTDPGQVARLAQERVVIRVRLG